MKGIATGNHPSDIVSCFRILIANYTNPATAKNHLNFVSSLEKFLNERPLQFDEVDKSFVEAYTASLVNQGKRQTYIAVYLQYFRSLYNKAVRQGFAPKTDAFEKVESTKPKAASSGLQSGQVKFIQQLIGLELSETPQFDYTRDLFLFTLFMGGLSWVELSGLKKTDLQSGYLFLQSSGRKRKLLPVTLRIIEKYRNSQSDFLFALGQGNTEAETQNKQQYLNRLHLLLRAVSRSFGSINEDTALSCYIATALELGIQAAQIKGSIDRLPSESALAWIEKDTLSQEQTDRINEQIAFAIWDDREHWYSMRMFRPVEEILSLLQKEAELNPLEIYYPIEEVARRVGKKIEEYKSPVIKNVLFFRTTEEKTKKLSRYLFGKVNIYKSISSQKEKFAIISDYEMYMFRMIVSDGAEEISFEPVEKEQFAEGKRVRILEGKFCGYEGIVVKSKGNREKEEADNLIIVNLCNIQFRVTAKIPDVWLKLLQDER